MDLFLFSSSIMFSLVSLSPTSIFVSRRLSCTFEALLAPQFLLLTYRMIYKYYQEGTRLLGPSEISWEQSRIAARIVSRRTPG